MRTRDRFGSIANFELPEDMVEVLLGRAHSDGQLIRDFLVSQPKWKQPDQFKLPVGKRLRERRTETKRKPALRRTDV